MEVGISRIHRGAPLVSACTALSLLSFSSQDKPDPNGRKELAVVPKTAIQALSFVSGRVEVPKTTDGEAHGRRYSMPGRHIIGMAFRP
jgi:hypothetical protein